MEGKGLAANTRVRGSHGHRVHPPYAARSAAFSVACASVTPGRALRNSSFPAPFIRRVYGEVCEDTEDAVAARAASRESLAVSTRIQEMHRVSKALFIAARLRMCHGVLCGDPRKG